MIWELFTKRTEDPKLSWLENKLDEAGIPHRRRGHSSHAPITEVPVDQLDSAWRLLDPIDDIPDDDPVFTEDPDGCACGPPEDGQCAFCQVKSVVTELKNHE